MGKRPEQALAKGMDRVDAKPDRRIDDTGEQPPCAIPHAAVRDLDTEPDERRRKLFVGGRRPPGELALYADAHFGGGRAGIGEAEDAFRQGALKQQGQHAVGQHLGLAGSRIGVHPGRRLRVSGAVLLRGCGLDRRVHSRRDHSSFLERCR